MVEYTTRHSSSILSKASGYIGSYDYTLNPYSGCAFGCSYCYAASFAPTRDKRENWGSWVDVKENALELLKKKRKRPLIDQTIYISSVTDPYQPIERKLQLTRGVLQELLDYHSVKVVIQTRSPIVTRDIDLLTRFTYARVNVTITTDDDEVRRAFEPRCPSIQQRMDAVQQVAAAGIFTAVTMAPLLPVRQPQAFAERLRATGARRFVTQYFQPKCGPFAGGTAEEALLLAELLKWTPQRYAEVRAIMGAALPNLYEGRDGFAPNEWNV